MNIKPKFLDRIRQSVHEARERGEQAMREVRADQAIALDQAHTRKALKRSPESPVLITRVITTDDAQQLIGKGWRLRSSNRLQQWGSDLMSEHWLEKDNPYMQG